MVHRPCNNGGEPAQPRSAVMQTGAFKSLQESTQDRLEALKVPVALFQAPQSETLRVQFGGCSLV